MVPKFVRATAGGTFLDGGVTGQLVELGTADRKIAAPFPEPSAGGASRERAAVAPGNTATVKKTVATSTHERTLTTRILGRNAPFQRREGACI